MMKFSQSILFLVVIGLLTGCHDILNKEDLTAVGKEQAWNDPQLASAYINNIYHDNLPGWGVDDDLGVFDQAEASGRSLESRGETGYMYGQLTENSVDFWPYGDIREINVLLAEIDDGTLDQEMKQKLKGEAYFFRAWRYFELAIRYGGVPLVLEPQNLEDDLLVKRSTTEETFNQIISDLDAAIETLPTVSASSDQNDGRVHKGTALALKGRVLLFWASEQFDPDQSGMERWQAAFEANLAAKEHLEANGFGLYESFEDIWFDEMNPEAIFVRRYQFPQVTHQWSAGNRPLDVSQSETGNNWPVLEMIRAFPMQDGKKIDDPSSNYTYDENYYWQNRDPRFYATIAYNGAHWGLEPVGSSRMQWTYSGAESNNPTETGFYMRKAVDPNQNADEAANSGTDWIEIRYAEVLLNLAEAANEIGQQQEAYSALTRIRDRAGLDPGPGSLYGLEAGMAVNEMRDAILYERKIELAYEGKRYWDLRRRRLYEEELNGLRRHGYNISLKVTQDEWENFLEGKSPQEIIQVLNENYTDYFSHTEKEIDTQSDINWQDEYYFYAIPSEHLQLNSNLEQTEGWPGGSFDIPGSPD